MQTQTKNLSIPDSEVWTEWVFSVKKTGLTPALQKARRVLGVLLNMEPEHVEKFLEDYNQRGIGIV